MRTLLQVPSSAMNDSVERAWPTANSPISRYCRSATRSSHSALSRPRRSGLGTNGDSQDTSISAWNANAVSRVSSGACALRFTRNTDTDRVPTGTPPSHVARGPTARADSAIARPPASGIGTSRDRPGISTVRNTSALVPDARKRKRSYRSRPPLRPYRSKGPQAVRHLGEMVPQVDSHPI